MHGSRGKGEQATSTTLPAVRRSQLVALTLACAAAVQIKCGGPAAAPEAPLLVPSIVMRPRRLRLATNRHGSSRRSADPVTLRAQADLAARVHGLRTLSADRRHGSSLRGRDAGALQGQTDSPTRARGPQPFRRFPQEVYGPSRISGASDARLERSSAVRRLCCGRSTKCGGAAAATEADHQASLGGACQHEGA